MAVGLLACCLVCGSIPVACAQEALGAIRGIVTDREFEAPLGQVTITVAERGARTDSNESGHFVFQGVPAGAYTLVAAKSGFERLVKSHVVVSPGGIASVALAMTAEVTAMEEFVVRPIELDKASETGDDIGATLAAELAANLGRELAAQIPTEIGLLALRAESAGIVDSVGKELMSKAGAGSAAEAIKLVAGATVADDKYAVIRGLSDRFVNTRVNSIVMPTADPDVRAVQLDLFPSALLESVRVHKTFTPDLPGNTSGGSVDIVTPDAPEHFVFEMDAGLSFNTRSTGNRDFLVSGQSFDYFGVNPGPRQQTLESGTVALALSPPRTPYVAANPSQEWQDWLANARTLENQVRSLSPVFGPTRTPAPPNHSWGITYGDRLSLAPETSVGWLAAFTYSSKYSHREGLERNMVSGGRHSPDLALFGPAITSSEDPDDIDPDQWTTRRSRHTVGWGLGTVLQFKHFEHSLKLNYLRTQQTEEDAMDYWDVQTNVNEYWRNESLIYTARSLESLQLLGRTPLTFLGFPLSLWRLELDTPRIDWAAALGSSVQDQPDQRFFLGAFDPNTGRWGAPQSVLDFAQRSWRTISEETTYYSAELRWPFAIGKARKGALKLGWALEDTARTYTQDTFVYKSNTVPRTPYAVNPGSFQIPWSRNFLDPERLGYAIFGTGADFSSVPHEANWLIHEFTYDVDYTGALRIPAHYGMVELPVFPWFKLIGGARVEHTSMTTEVHAANGDDSRVLVLDVRKYLENLQDPGKRIPLGFESPATKGTTLSELADASIEQTDLLPSLGFTLDVFAGIRLRGTWSRTIGRPTFKELTPVSQQDHLGAQTFAGNPTLTVSRIENRDLRLEWNPGDGRLLSLSGFTKDIIDPIDYSLRPTQFGIPYILPFNYPTGLVVGIEFEARHDLGRFHPWLRGLTVGGSFTWLDASVTLPTAEATRMKDSIVQAKKIAAGIPPLDPTPPALANSVEVSSRRMKDQPGYLGTLYLLHDLPETGTSWALFLNQTGEILVAGESWTGEEYIPNRVKKPFTSLDFSISQKLWRHGKLSLSVSNILDPVVREVWQSDFVAQGEASASEYRRGRTISLSISASW